MGLSVTAKKKDEHLPLSKFTSFKFPDLEQYTYCIVYFKPVLKHLHSPYQI